MLLSSYTLPPSFNSCASWTYEQVITECLPWLSTDNCKVDYQYAYYKGAINYKNKIWHCYQCGNYTIHARENKLALFKSTYCQKTRQFTYEPPIVVRISNATHGYNLRIYHKDN